MCFPPETWSCLSHSRAEYFPLDSRLAKRWKSHAAERVKSCPQLTPDLHGSSRGLHLCHLLVLSAAHRTLALDLRYSKQDVLTLSALQQHWQQNNFATRAKSLSCMPRSAPQNGLSKGEYSFWSWWSSSDCATLSLRSSPGENKS